MEVAWLIKDSCYLFAQKKEELRREHGETAQKILELTDKANLTRIDLQEVNEALSAGKRVLEMLLMRSNRKIRSKREYIMKGGVKTMKIKFLTITLLITALCLTTSCAKQQKEIEIYSFSGESDAAMINSGLIIATDDLEKFIGGELTFKGEEPSNVKYCVTKFFFYKDGVETTILSNSESIEGTSKGTKISPNMGSISSKDLFYGNDLEQINKSLNFSVSGIFVNGGKFEYNVVLDVEKAY